MANLKRTPVTYRPFQGQAILADGLLAVARPGGEVAETIARSLFGLADTFRQDAERIAQARGERLGRQAAQGAVPRVSVAGGEVAGPEFGPPMPPKAGAATTAAGALAPLEFQMAGVRQMPLAKPLQTSIQQAVAAVYGPGYKGIVYSGGQVEKGKPGPRTGSSRHDHGNAADIYVVGPDGKRVTGERLALLGQYWLASKIGGVGLEMKGGGIHLDLHKDRAPHWNYLAKGGRYTPEMARLAQAGLAGKMPELRGGPPPAIEQAFARAAARHGESVALMTKIASIETGGTFNPNAKNPNSSAAGLFQVIKATAARYGVTNPYDIEQAADFGARFLRDNRRLLTTRLGRPPTDGELYLAHQQGAGGAAKLLANPGAPVESVIGRDAARLNGAKPGMTAGEFAAKWTSKAGDSTSSAFVAGPTRRSPVTVDVTGGGLALTGRDTIYGRAYDRAAVATYRAHLQDRMLDGAAEIAERLQDDPAAMGAAFDELRAKLLTDDVPEDLRFDFSEGFDRLSAGYLRKSQKAHDTRLEAADRDAFNAEENRLREGVSRAETGLDPDAPESADVLAAEAARLKDHWREGVARGYLSPEEAAEKARVVDGRVAARFYLKQAEALPPEDIPAFRDGLKADYVAGKLPQVDAAAWRAIEEGLGGIERQGQQDRARASREVARQQKDILDRAAAGEEIPEDEIEAFRQMAKDLPEGETVATGVTALVDVAKLLRAGPPAAAEARLEALRKGFGTAPTALEKVMLKQGEAMIAAARKELAADPLGYAAKAGVIEDPGSMADVQDAAGYEGFIRGRMDLADEAGRHYGVPPLPFRPGEAAALEGNIRQNPEQGAAMAGALVKGAGARAPEVLRGFGRSAPALTAAGAIVAGGGSLQAAADAIAGAGRTPDGREYSVKGQQARRSRGREMTGVAMIFQIDDERRVLDAAEWIARKRLYDMGMDGAAPEAIEVYEQALQEAAGASFAGEVQYGGFADYDPQGFWTGKQRVMVPPDVRGDMLYDLFEQLRDEDVESPPIGGTAGLVDYWPVLTSAGYVFVDFNADGEPLPLEAVDGRPFVLDLEALKPKLGPRVPGAFRGY